MSNFFLFIILLSFSSQFQIVNHETKVSHYCINSPVPCILHNDFIICCPKFGIRNYEFILQHARHGHGKAGIQTSNRDQVSYYKSSLEYFIKSGKPDEEKMFVFYNDKEFMKVVKELELEKSL